MTMVDYGSTGTLVNSTATPSVATNNEQNPAPDQQTQRHELRKEIGLIEGTALTIGSIVGSGIFISPKGIVENVGSVALSLIIWAACGLISIVGAMCYAELGTSFPSSGGEYHYLYVAFGPVPAFLFIWANVVIFVPCNIAVLAISFSQYVIKPFFSCDNPVPDSALRLLAGSAICTVIFVNCASVRLAAKIQNAFGVTKVISLAFIVVLGIIAFAQGKTDNFEDPFKDSKTDVGSIALAFFSGIYAFGGANTLNFVIEEVKNPSKTVPRSIYISMAVVIVFYLFVNVCYFTVLSPADMIASDAVAVNFGDETLGSGLTWIIPAFVAISTFGGLLINIMPYSRAILVGARNGHFPEVLSHVQTTQLTPMPSLLFMCALSLIYLSITDIFKLINYAGFLYAVVAVATAGALLYLRRTRPDHPRPVKVALWVPISYFVVSLFLFALPLYEAPIEAAVGCGITLTGLPVYYFCIYKPKHSESKTFAKITDFFDRLLESMTVVAQKLLLCMPADNEDEDLIVVPPPSLPLSTKL